MIVKNIALVINGGLGDHVKFSNLISKIKLNVYCKIFIITANKIDYWSKIPYVDHVVMCPNLNTVIRFSDGGIDLSDYDRHLEIISSIYFDVIINPSHGWDYLLDSIIVSKLNGKRKIGFRQFKFLSNEIDTNLFYNELIDLKYERNVFNYHYYILDALGIKCKFDYDVFIGHDFNDMVKVDDYIENVIKNNKKQFLVGIHPDGSGMEKQLSVESVSKISELISSFGWQPIILTSARAYLKCGTIPTLTIPETSYLVSKMSLLICPCSGYKHIAAYHNIRVIELEHLPANLEGLNGPYITDEIKFSTGDYWTTSIKHSSLKLNGSFELDRVLDGTSINSHSVESIYNAMKL